MKRGREKFNKFKKVLNLLVTLLSFLPLSSRKWLFTFVGGLKGIFGIGIRFILIKSLAKKCGDNVSIHPDVLIFHPENIVIGDNVSIHPWSYIDAVGEVEIGTDVSIAHSTTILSSTHNYTDKNISIKDQGLRFKRTVIEDNVWIGAKVTILYGILVESGSIIGANSLVTKNVARNSIVGGNPANIIKRR